jgi:anti-sigma regulatory factor (Ser/Thr protein kinase)
MTSAQPPRKNAIVIANTITEMAKVVDFVDRFGVAHRIPADVSNALNLCLDELLNNTISYGYTDRNTHDIRVELTIANGVLTAEITDDGLPFDPTKARLVIPDQKLQARRPGGLGIHFVKALMDELRYARKGKFNIVRISRKLGRKDDGNR